MTIAKILLLAMALVALSLHDPDRVPVVRGEFLGGNATGGAVRGDTGTQQATENLIHVEISGLRNDQGVVMCALYASADGFPKNADKALARTKSVISNEQAVCEFAEVKPGTYAVSVYHDENSNGKMDTNFMGMPKEGVGASNHAKGHFGPPKFSAAAFRFPGGRLELKISITYL